MRPRPPSSSPIPRTTRCVSANNNAPRNTSHDIGGGGDENDVYFSFPRVILGPMTRCELRKAAKEEEEGEKSMAAAAGGRRRREVKFIVRRPSQFGTMTTHTHSRARAGGRRLCGRYLCNLLTWVGHYSSHRFGRALGWVTQSLVLRLGFE